MRLSRSEYLACSHERIALSLEPLEPRLLLSTSLLVSPAWFGTVDGVYEPGSMIDQYGTETIEWNDADVEAISGSWIVQFTESAVEGMTSVVETAALLTDDIDFEVVRGLGLVGQVLIQVGDAAASEVEAWLSANPDVGIYQPDIVISGALTPNDPLLNNMWGLENTGQYGGVVGADIDALAAWDLEVGDPSVVVAVIDSGVDYTHPDLAANMWMNPGEVGGLVGVDDDGNGFIDDIYGWDFFDGDNDPMDEFGHGTHVAGTIAAVGNNAMGVTGVSWNTTIMPIRFLGPANTGSTADAILSIEYATMMKTEFDDGAGDGNPGGNVLVTNNSWGGGGFDAGLLAAIAASGTAGQLFVAAAGNSGLNNDIVGELPASYDLDNIISVAASDRFDQIASFSNYGIDSVDIAAPGVDIMSTLPSTGPAATGSLYGLMDGTSMASPHVAGVAALCFAYNPAATVDQVRDAILSGGDTLPQLGGYVGTSARLNAYNALLRVLYPDPALIPIDTVTQGFASVSLYDTQGPVDVVPGDIMVNFGGGSTINRILVVGDGGGIGIVATTPSTIGNVVDRRADTSKPAGFFATDAPVNFVWFKGGLSGADLNDRTLGGIIFPADIDSDGLIHDRNGLYFQDYAFASVIDGGAGVDAYLGGNQAGASGRYFVVRQGDWQGELTTAQDLGLASFQQSVPSTGGVFIGDDLGMLSIGQTFSGLAFIGDDLGRTNIGGDYTASGVMLVGGTSGPMAIGGLLAGDYLVDENAGVMSVGAQVEGALIEVGASLRGLVAHDWIGADLSQAVPGTRIKAGNWIGFIRASEIFGFSFTPDENMDDLVESDAAIFMVGIFARHIGTVAVDFGIRGARIMAGTDFGDDYTFGGVGSDADTFLSGTIENVITGMNIFSTAAQMPLPDPVWLPNIANARNSLITAGMLPAGAVAEPATFTPDLLSTFAFDQFLAGSYIRNIDVAGIIFSEVPIDLTDDQADYAPWGFGSYAVMRQRQRGLLWYYCPQLLPSLNAVYPLDGSDPNPVIAPQDPALVFALYNPGAPTDLQPAPTPIIPPLVPV